MRTVWATIVICGAALSFVVACSTSNESTGSTTDVPTPTGDPYHIEVKAPSKANVGEESTAEIIVTPGSGYKINQDYPAKLTIGSVPAGTKVPEKTVTKAGMTVEKTRLLVPVRFVSEAPGEKRFEGELRFSVCTPQFCKMPHETVTWTTTVEAAAP